LRILLDRELSACYHEHMNRCSYIETKGEDSMTGLEQTAPEKEKQPVEMPDDEVLYELADLFRVFGDSTRIKILYALHDSELCVQDIADAVQLSQSAVSHQLRVLKDSKLVRFRREGKTVFYALDDDHVRSILSMGMDHIEE
jgi:DNA-binding transcriptional ArsR family regulator